MKSYNMKEKISFKEMVISFMAAFVLTAGVFTITSIFGASEALAAGSGSSGGSIFSTIAQKMWQAVGSLRTIAYVLAAFGMVAFTWGAIFNKISWKHFGNIMISLFILSVMTPMIEYVVYGSGSKDTLQFGDKYVPAGDHSSLEQDKTTQEEPNGNEADCDSNPDNPECQNDSDEQKCIDDGGTWADGKCDKGGEGTEGGEGEGTEGEEGGEGAEGEGGEGTEGEGGKPECAELSGDAAARCNNSNPPAKPEGNCNPKESDCTGKYISKESCNGDKACEKAADKHNKEVNKEYKDAQKAYDKEQKEIAKDKYEARKDNIQAGQEVNCDGLTASQCNSLQRKQDKADNKQKKEDIQNNYQAALKACGGDPDCEKQAKKDKNAATNELNKQAFNNAMERTHNAVDETRQRVDDLKGTISGVTGAIGSISAGIDTATRTINTIKNTSDNMTEAFNGDGSFLDKAGAFFQGTATITNAAGTLASTAGNTVGDVTSGMSHSANSFQDLTSSSSQRDENQNTRNHGGTTNAFSGVMDDVADGSYSTGNAVNGLSSNAGGAFTDMAKTADQADTVNANVNHLLDSIDNSKNTLGK